MLFGLSSVKATFERACALPVPGAAAIMGAACELLASTSDGGRKNAVLFLGEALHTRGMLEQFDAQVGGGMLEQGCWGSSMRRWVGGCWGMLGHVRGGHAGAYARALKP